MFDAVAGGHAVGVGTGTATGGAASPALGGDDYDQLKRRIRELVRDVVPARSTVLVVSKGDDDLVKFDGRRGWHFPQDDAGKYAGFHPSDSAEAIAHLEALHKKGAEYLVFPTTALWWLDHYAELKLHLESQYPLVVENERTCLIFRLTDRSVSSPGSHRDFPRGLSDLMDHLLPSEATVAFVTLRDDRLIADVKKETWRFPEPSSYDEAGAVDDTRALQDKGAEFIAISRIAAERMMDQYPEFLSNMRNDHRLVTRQEHHGEIYEVIPTGATHA
jgi:hypothetical protein